MKYKLIKELLHIGQDEFRYILYRKKWLRWERIDCFYSVTALVQGIQLLLENPLYEGSLEQIYEQVKNMEQDNDK